MAKKDSQMVSIHYDERANKPTLSISGVYGGPNPDGTSVVAHVFADWGMVPSISQIPVNKQGVGDLSKEQTIKRGDINREIQATLIMPPEVALSIGGWLIQKAKAALDSRRPVEISKEGEIDAGS